jgi:diacylglycerol O-acyltransferase / wax synthase
MSTRASMSGADAAWLHMDRPRNLMVVTTILHLDGRPDWDAVQSVLARRMVARFPRFRSRPLDPPVTIGLINPRCREEQGFRIERHVTRSSADSLEAHVAARASEELDRSRPLWHADLVDLGSSSAVVLRTHHAMADGAGLVRVVTAATDGAEPPTPAPSRAPVDEAAIQREVRALVKLGDRMVRRGAGDVPFTEPLGGDKAVAQCRAVPVAALKALGRTAGVTVNDIYLAAVAGALRSHLGPSADRDLDAAMPMNIRRADEPPDELGNRFGLVVVSLPVATDDADERPAEVGRRARAIKATTEAEVVARALTTLGRVPVRAQLAWTDNFIGDAVAVITNVAGPPVPVTLAGTPVAGMSLFVPSTGPIGLGVSLFSYAGKATVSVIADGATMPDCEPFARALERELTASPSA